MLANPIYYFPEREKLLVLLPPGLGCASHFDSVVNQLSDGYGVVTFDLPGVNPNWLESEIEDIARDISSVLNQLGHKRIVLLGESYGGVLAIELQKYFTKADALVLVGTGEFFHPMVASLLSVLFILPGKFVPIRNLFVRVISMCAFPMLTEFTDAQLQTVLRRWIGILNYRLPRYFISNTKTFIVSSKYDRIVRRGSRERLHRIFPNSVEINCSGSHFEYIEWIRRQFA